MARPPTGAEALERARAAVATARTVGELRAAQAVVLPLDFGLSLAQTARIVGRTPAWVSRIRRRFIVGASVFTSAPGRGGRRNALLSEADEVELVKRGVIDSNRTGNTVRSQVRKLLDQRFEHAVAESTTSGIMARVAAKWFPSGAVHDLQFSRHELVQRWSAELAAKEKADRRL